MDELISDLLRNNLDQIKEAVRERQVDKVARRPPPRPGRAKAPMERASHAGMDPSPMVTPPCEPTRQRVAHRQELGLRLGELGLGVGVGDDAAAGEQAHLVCRRCSAERRAMPNSPSPAASIQPTGPA